MRENPHAGIGAKLRMPTRRASAESALLPTKLRTRLAVLLSDQRTIGVMRARSRDRSRLPRTLRWLR